MKQIPLDLSAQPAQRFDTFLPGGNAAALLHLRELEASAAPVYLWGASGSGKTHLLRSLALAHEERGQRVAWFGARQPAPWHWSEGTELVVLDGCDAYDAAQQHAAFALFVEATTGGVPIVAAGRVPPVDLPLREDLRSRLGWGHVFAVQPLSEAEVRSALRVEADRRGLFLSDEVMGYLLTRFERDMKHLMTMLDRLDGFALAAQRGITVPLLKQMLVEESP